MSDSVRIDIHATDNASKVFGAVGGAAAKMGNQLDDVGDAFTALTKDYGMTEAAARDLLASQGMVVSSLDKVDTAATDASRGINKLETETKQLAPALKQTGDAARTAGNNFKEYESELRQVGLGVGVLAGAMALSGQSFRNQEIAIDNLRRTYGDAADGLVDFADEIQRTTNFSNDAAIAAANSFGTLARNYELSVSQIEALIARSADLAATSGFSLEEAAQRVQAAIRGEAESAEMLGLTMNQMAIDHDNVTFSMSNAEAGAFRFAAIMDQSTFSMGAAEAQANTFYGTLTEVRDTVQDAAQSFGEFIGPFGELGAFAADNVVEMAALGIGLTQVAKAAMAARTAISAGGLAGALVGGGGLIAVTGLAVAGIIKLSGVLDEELSVGAGEAVDAFDQLIDKIIATGDAANKTAEEISFENWIQGISEVVTANEAIIAQFEDKPQTIAHAVTEQEQAIADAYGMEIDSGEELIAFRQFMADEIGRLAEANDFYLAVADEMAFAHDQEGEAATRLRISLRELVGQVENEIITEEEGIAAIEGKIAAYKDEAIAAQEATESTVNLGDAMANMVANAEDAAAVLEAVGEAGKDAFAETAEQIASVSEEMAGFAQAAKDAFGETGEELAAQFERAADAAQTAKDAFAATAEALAEAAASIKEARIDLFTRDWNALTAQFTQTSEALDNTFRIIVGGTNTIASQSQAVADWATELIAVEGTYSILDDLLNAGRINLLQYNVAQEAHNDIIRENAEIQEHVQTIQAQQAPVLAELMAAQENYVQSLTERSSEEQVAALAMMDTATNAKALEIALLAAQGAGAEALTPIIEGAIAANPPLEAVLETMGLVARDHEGNLIVNTSGEDGVTALIDALDRATQATWVATFDGDISAAEAAYNTATGMNVNWDNLIGTSTVAADNAPATSAISWAQTVLATWGGSSAAARVNVVDNASGILAGVQSMLNNLNGQVATTYVQTIALQAKQMGLGGVAGYADGGVVAKMAEWGPEMLHFPNGGIVVAQTPGIYSVPQGTYVDTAPATAAKMQSVSGGGVNVVINVAGSVGVDDLTEQVTRQLVPAIQRAASQHMRSYGL
jgi:hypothetical protein